MKKIFGIILTVALVFGFAGTSMAALANSQLYRAVYSVSGTLESLTNLGTLGGEIAISNGTVTNNPVFNTSNFSLSGLGVSSFSDVYVAYFAKNGPTGSVGQAWVTGDTTENSYFQFQNVFQPIRTVAEGTTSTQAKSSTSSYVYRMDGNGTKKGDFNSGFLIPSGTTGGEALLSSLVNGSSTSYVQQNLYYFASDSTTGQLAAYIRTYGDGHTSITAAPVPVPPSVMLLVPGLLGLIGIRRKLSA
jgi:hypothetical protein